MASSSPMGEIAAFAGGRQLHIAGKLNRIEKVLSLPAARSDRRNTGPATEVCWQVIQSGFAGVFLR